MSVTILLAFFVAFFTLPSVLMLVGVCRETFTRPGSLDVAINCSVPGLELLFVLATSMFGGFLGLLTIPIIVVTAILAGVAYYMQKS